MSPLPTISLRCAPEHTALIRDLARALRTRPELADILAAMLTDPTTAAPSPMLADVVARLEAVERWIAERNTDAPPCNTAPMPDALPDDFPDRLRDARKAKGWSTRTLATEAGVSQTTISQIENRRTPGTPDNRAKIVAALQLGEALTA